MPWPPGDGEMARQIREHDWAATPLGPIEGWSGRLKLMVETVLDTPHVSSLVCGPEWILIYNDAAARLYGGRHPHALGRPLPSAFPEGWATVAPLYARAFAGEAVQVAAQPLDTRGEGAAADAFDATLIPVRDDAGAVVAVHMTGQEVGARFRAEAVLRERERQLAAELAGTHLLQRLSTRLIPEQSPDVLHEQILDAAQQLMQADAVSIQLLDDDGQRLRRLATRNLHPESTEYWTWVDASHASTCGQALRENRRVLVEDVETNAELAETGDLEAFRRSGTRAVQSTPLVSRSGRPIGMISTHWRAPRRLDEGEFGLFDALARQVADLLERSQTETALRASEERHRLLIESWAQAVWETDASGVVTADSPSWRAYTGQTLEEWLGYGWLDAIHPDDRAYAERQWREAVAARGLVDAEFRLRAPDGGWRWTNVRAAPVIDAAGRVEKWVGMNIDIDAHKAAEAALRESEERYRSLFESMDEAYAVLEVLRDEGGAWCDFRFIEVNRAFIWHTSMPYPVGRTATELLGTPNPRWTQLYGQALDTGEPLRVQEAEPTLGRVFDLNIFSLDRDRNRVAVLFTDITKRIQAEAALRESEERFRQFGDASPDVLWIRGAESLDWEYLSPAFEMIYGMRVGQAMAGEGLSQWLDLIVAEDRERAAACIARVREGARVRFEYRVRRPDGGLRWLRNTDFPIRGLGGAVERIGGVGQDITELKRAETALREEEARQRALVEGMPQLVWRSADSGQWTWSSPQWRNYTGQDLEQSRGWGWLDALHPKDREAARAAWGVAGVDGLLQLDCRIRHAGSGRYGWFQTRGVPVRGNGRVIEWVGTCTDIDDQMRARDTLRSIGEELEARVAERTAELMAAEESLRQAQKMEAVGQLTGGIAHDFNNMLQGIAGAVDMARRRVEEHREKEVGRYLDAARDATNRAAGLTRRLLAFARQQRLEPRPVEADKLISGLADLIRRTVGPSVAMELKLHDGNGSVLCDANELESAVLNLSINARDAMPEGGRLVIGTQELDLSAQDMRDGDARPGRYVAISVADSGTGMPPEVLDRVFEPFFTTKPQGKGTGLGLSQVWGFVRQSGGLVRIESAAGHGTTVRLFLPLHENLAPQDEDPRPTSDLPSRARGTVLLVDDEDGVRGPAADRLRELGLAVREARDGPEALRVLDTARPDLLVTDVGLPNGMNGREVAEAARERIADLPVLFITGYAATALPPGVQVIGKPFALDALAHRVQAILAAKNLHPDGNPGT